ncbi:SWIB/MDM2 domain [Pseudocohnilembus persalinus]|uniref:SWIB/MDM2 domain n=1 Tax=Pseudocohnilembus persalinus TaxID=266149 RepID=A0A0V0QDK5_PSEPJ|nr:SWIB/MDM2 domain [Pseudocohnilembus persalinus]|eukprot:KRX00181.1 SWIB/MDM2 domain [Pseudocohnilembus persalinus]
MSNRKVAGMYKQFKISQGMKTFLKKDTSNYPEALKQIWKYAKQNNLNDKQYLNIEKDLKLIFPNQDRIHMYQISRLLNENNHFIKDESNEQKENQQQQQNEQKQDEQQNEK